MKKLILFFVLYKSLLAQFGGGSGTALDPYQITSPSHLEYLATQVNSGTNYSTSFFKLMNNLDLSSITSWTPIGNSEVYSFCGNFDGNNKNISGLTITGNLSYQGLFGSISDGCEIKNLSIQNCSVSGSNYVGGLVGYIKLNSNNSTITITNCHVSGTISSTIDNVGGLIGKLFETSSASGGETYNVFISICSSNCSVTCTSTYASTGGLIGAIEGNSGTKNPRVSNCFSLGTVTNNSNGAYVGGLIGQNTYGKITDCYSRTDVIASGTDPYAAGMIGYALNGTVINKSYSAGLVNASGSNALGFFGYYSSSGSSVSSCFWDKETSGKNSSFGGSGVVGKTTAEMKTASTFFDASWSETIWFMDTFNDGYAYLSWQNPGGTPVPVELTSFTAKQKDNLIFLSWNTSTEIGNYGFEVERASTSLSTDFDVFEKIGFINGNGNSNVPHNYSFIDNSINKTGTYYYRLKQIDTDGSYEYSYIIEINVNINNSFSISQNYPNPFNPFTKIKYSVPVDGLVTLKVYNILGKEIKTLVNENLNTGIYEIEFDGRALESGLYFYKIETGNYSAINKMILIK